jgi:predicted ATPase
MRECSCPPHGQSKRIVLTGGPGAGKTAVLELVRQAFCRHVRVLPEAAGIVFGGGFPREPAANAQRAAQRAIFHVQTELEALGAESDLSVVFCDRGTVDSAAYWPGPPSELWDSVNTTLEEQLARYDTVIHLRTPGTENGYHNRNPLRVETAVQAGEIDRRIERLWAAHPHRFLVEAEADFLGKAERTLQIIRGELPPCCSESAATEWNMSNDTKSRVPSSQRAPTKWRAMNDIESVLFT